MLMKGIHTYLGCCASRALCTVCCIRCLRTLAAGADDYRVPPSKRTGNNKKTNKDKNEFYDAPKV
jgi:hypothetical protein